MMDPNGCSTCDVFKAFHNVACRERDLAWHQLEKAKADTESAYRRGAEAMRAEALDILSCCPASTLGELALFRQGARQIREIKVEELVR